jgi:hypothetical protein
VQRPDVVADAGEGFLHLRASSTGDASRSYSRSRTDARNGWATALAASCGVSSLTVPSCTRFTVSDGPIKRLRRWDLRPIGRANHRAGSVRACCCTLARPPGLRAAPPPTASEWSDV